jgi:hypothetical protein
VGGKTIREIYFLPPLALARVGGSTTPLDSFRWQTSVGVHGAHQTTIEPAVSFDIAADGTPRARLPNEIRFRDGGLLRPVAPFFELWARVGSEAGGVRQEDEEMPLTLGLLAEFGADLTAVRYRITVANRKAERRTLLPSCGFIARLDVPGNDHARRPLLACSPFSPGSQPLVRAEHPIPLGEFQVVRPVRSTVYHEDLSILRVRFTPAKGEVYGPPVAGLAMAKVLPEGGFNPPTALIGRMYELVPEKNRILNPDTPWSSYAYDGPEQEDPQPSDSYDGSSIASNVSWGVVDDLCDGILEAQVVLGGHRFVANARLLSTNPDYSPDRRPFFSVADDLADRDLPDPQVDDACLEDAEAEIADLFQRVFETASQVNVDVTRARALEPSDDGKFGDLPKTDGRSMTAEDEPYANLAPTLLAKSTAGAISTAAPNDPIPYALLAQRAHARLTSIEKLLDLLLTRPDHIRQLIRPPFGRFSQFAADPTDTPHVAFRDPRVTRDTQQDMRMPPYMRDSDENPLSLTWRQYHLLMKFLDHIVAPDPSQPPDSGQPSGPRSVVSSPVRRRVAQIVAQLRQDIGKQQKSE